MLELEPIKARYENTSVGSSCEFIVHKDGSISIRNRDDYLPFGDIRDEWDRDFVVNAFRDIPALIAEVERLRMNNLSELQGEIDRLTFVLSIVATTTIIEFFLIVSLYVQIFGWEWLIG
jgi:hypothetical protein